MHNMYGLSLARHLQGEVGHVQWSSHCGIVLSYALVSQFLLVCFNFS